MTGTGPKCDRPERFRRNHQLARLGCSRRRPRKRSRATSPCLPAAPWAGEEPYDGHWPSRRARGAPPHPPGCHRPLINRRDGVTHLQPEPARRKRLSPSPIRAPTPGARSRSRKSRAARRDRLADQCPRQSVDHGRRPAHRRLSRRDDDTQWLVRVQRGAGRGRYVKHVWPSAEEAKRSIEQVLSDRTENASLHECFPL